MVTTIQLNEDVKKALDRLKSNKETYEDVIISLMKTAEKCKKEREDFLIEGCKEMYQDMIDINKEWEAVDADFDWEWNED
jgi:predicted CopG family antitoxin